MAEATTNEALIQPNQYAGGIPAPPFSMPNAKILPSDPGGAPSSGSQGQGGSDLTMDGDMSMSGPGTHLQGTQQNTDPTQSGDAQPTNPGSDFQNTVTNTKPGINQVGGSGPASSGTATGWCKSGNDWYYIDPETGKLATGWKFIGNRWYYLDPETGVMVTGWVMSKGLWYYLEPGDGHMLTDWQTINGNEYYLETDNGNGNMVTGWKWRDDAWYFLHEDGAMAYGDWLMIDEKWYYFHPDGRMAALEIAVYDKNGEKYYLGADGAMITSAIIQRVTYNGIEYDVAEDGVCTENDDLPNKINRFVQAALNEKGTVETGNNGTKYNNWYYRRVVSGSNYSWCSVFVLWAGNEAGILDGIIMPTIEEARKKIFEGQANLKNWYNERGRLAGREYNPKAGDIFFFAPVSHVGIVAAYDVDADKIYLIEGNSGDAVRLQPRPRSDVDSFGINGGNSYGTVPDDGELNPSPSNHYR